MFVTPTPIVPLYIAVGTIPVAVPFVPFLFERQQERLGPAFAAALLYHVAMILLALFGSFFEVNLKSSFPVSK